MNSWLLLKYALALLLFGCFANYRYICIYQYIIQTVELKQVEKISKALSDVNRLKILQYMQKNQGKVECTQACHLLALAQPSISHHIKKLVEAELIYQHKVGRNYNYSLNQEMWDNYRRTLKNL